MNAIVPYITLKKCNRDTINNTHGKRRRYIVDILAIKWDVNIVVEELKREVWREE